MAKSIKLLVYPVSDVEKAKTFYNAFLGVEPYADTPYYVGYRTGDQEIGLDPHSKDGPIAYTDVDDIQASLKEMTNAGAEVVQDITDVCQRSADSPNKGYKWECRRFEAGALIGIDGGVPDFVPQATMPTAVRSNHGPRKRLPYRRKEPPCLRPRSRVRSHRGHT